MSIWMPFTRRSNSATTPILRGRPVAVGGSSKRGVVAAASYEARAFGVKSAMPSVTAQRRCPDLVFVKPRFEVYRGVSRQIREIFSRHTDLIEPLALDEAYLGCHRDKQGIGSAVKIAKAIRAAIREETGLTASAGRQLQQIHRQAGERPEQARWIVHHLARTG
jgi:DNA polymerase-4